MDGNDQNPNQDQQEGEYKELPPVWQSYFRLKNSLKGPIIGRDEQGLSPKKFSKNYFEDTCPYCETTTDHEGKKHKYSKVTQRKIVINVLLMFAVAVATGIGLLNLLVGLGVIGIIGYTTSTHAERKMYYTLLCRKCGREFPMNREEQAKIREEQLKKRTEAADHSQEAVSQEEEVSEISEAVMKEEEVSEISEAVAIQDEIEE